MQCHIHGLFPHYYDIVHNIHDASQYPDGYILQ